MSGQRRKARPVIEYTERSAIVGLMALLNQQLFDLKGDTREALLTARRLVRLLETIHEREV